MSYDDIDAILTDAQVSFIDITHAVIMLKAVRIENPLHL
jgi:hypothetical protein